MLHCEHEMMLESIKLAALLLFSRKWMRAL